MNSPTQSYCVSSDTVPSGIHFAILSFRTLHIAGRYPDDDNVQYTLAEYTAYNIRSDWEAEIKRRMTSTVAADRNFVPLHVEPAKVSVSVSVKVS